MRQVSLTSYATGRFEGVRNELNDSAKQFGITNILSYDENDLFSSDYYRKNKSILDEICGAGYWAWKPYFILRALECLEQGAILFYCDAGSAFISSPAPLAELAAEHPQGLILFDARPLKNRQWTKRDCFVRMDCDKAAFWNSNKVIATILVVRKCGFSIDFIKEWTHYCQDRAAISDDPNECGKDNLRGYVQHRHDQAILSVLASKYRIETFRNPTLWGNFLKLPEFRVAGEPVLSPYGFLPEINTYASSPQENSAYGTIFEINRQPNFMGKPAWPITRSNPASITARILRRMRTYLTR
jgi:hypothetical protein